VSGPPTHPLPTFPRATTGPEGETLPAGLARYGRAMLVGTWGLVALTHLLQGTEGRLRTWPLSYLLLEVLACACLAYRANRASGEGRVAWWLLAVSAFLDIPNLLLTRLQLSGAVSAWAGNVTTLLSLLTGILVLVGVLSFPKAPERGGMFRRRLLDSLIFAASLLFLLWVMGVQGSLRSADQGVGLRVFVAYLNLALLGGSLVFMTSYRLERSRGPLGWLALSALAWLLAISCWTLAGLPSVLATRAWIVVAGGIPIFQGLAACSSQSVEVVPRPDPEHRGAGFFPYLPVTVSIAVMAGLLVWLPQNVNRESYAIFLVVVVLLLLRQFQAILDLQSARRTLEVRVVERTTALERAQHTLLRTERMNTLAMMGAGLAHDLNNLLGAVKGSADLAVLNLETGVVPGPTELNRIAMAADRAALLTRRLMEFARREEEGLQPLDLGREVAEMEVTLRLLLPRSVELRIEVTPGDRVIVKSSRLRVEQMLVNLVANAGDAMPRGGNLDIRVGCTGAAHAMIEVEDSGPGMAPEILTRIFEPFFTTKAPGKGTGLGLSSLRAMVEEGGGRISVESELGRGSRFRILLPLLGEDALSPR